MTTLESLFFYICLCICHCLWLKSFVWSIFTQEVMVTKTKNQAKSSKKCNL